jgi:fibronectin-binding autotransporter adhesin
VLGNTAVTVQSGAVLAGLGTIGGNVTIQDGGHLGLASAAQTLGVGSLLLNSGSILDYRLSTPGVIGSGVNTLVNVMGNLTLDGTLNVTNGGSFASGAYRLFNYSGTLTDLTLGLGILPTGFSASNVTVTTGVAGQVNLVVNGAGAPAQFWDGSNTVFDGTVHGGTGTWDNFTTNFTNAGVTVNQSWQNGTAIFSAAGGTVTLGDNILFQGMQFTISGYTIVGAGAFALQPTGTAPITTDPGVTATIAAPIVGTGGLNKTGLGELTLTGTNTYSGGTTITLGILNVASDTNLGNASGGLILNGGELLAANGFSSARVIGIQAGGGALATAPGGDASFSGNITGTGNLTIGDTTNSGVVSLSGTNTYSGSTTIVSGATLQALSTSALSTTSAITVTGTLDLNGFSNQIGSLAGAGKVTNGGSVGALLTAGDSSSTTFSGVLQDGTLTLGLTKTGTGTLTLTGANTYSGGTTVSAGALQAGSTVAFSPNSAFTVNAVLDLNGNSNSVGSLAGTGSVTNNSVTLAILSAGGDGKNTVFSGAVADGIGTVGLTKSGAGTLTLSGVNTYSGDTTISAGTLQAGSTTALSAISAFTANSILDLNGFSNTVGSLAGSGTVTNNGGTPAVLTAGGNGSDTTFSGTLTDGTGTLGLTKVAAGTMTLTGANTYNGGTTITGGTLQIGSGGTNGSIAGDVLNNGTLAFNRSDDITFANVVSGTGTLS